MVEEQALCRIHRVGQERPVTTIRYLMRESFEEVRTPSSPLQAMHAPIDCGPLYLLIAAY